MKENILKTLAYFDLFKMPLKADEVFKYLHDPHRGEVSDVIRELDNLVSVNKLIKSDNYYHLPDRSPDIITKRHESHQRSLELIKQTKPWLKRLATWPGVEMIAVCNTLAWLNAGEQSDVDLFIVTKPKMLWQTRFALASFLQIFKMRPQPLYQYGKICVSFLVTSDNLDLRPIAIDDDIYLSYWLRSLRPVYDPKNLMDKIYQINEPLLSGRPDNNQLPEPFRMKLRAHRLGRTALQPARLVRRPLEAVTKRFQMKKFPPDIRQIAASDSTNVVINDQMLKFHTNDRRTHYRDEWKKKI